MELLKVITAASQTRDVTHDIKLAQVNVRDKVKIPLTDAFILGCSAAFYILKVDLLSGRSIFSFSGFMCLNSCLKRKRSLDEVRLLMSCFQESNQ